MEKKMTEVSKYTNLTKIGRAHRVLAAAILSVGMSGFAEPASANGDEVNLYSYRQEFLIRPLLDSFTKETGIAVNVQYVKGGIL